MSDRKKYASEIMKLFVHRKDVYAVQVKSGENYIYIPKYEPLMESEIQRHLDGKITLGVYALNEDNTVKWMCFDIDHAHVEKPEEMCKIIAEKCVAQFGEEAVRIEESGTPHNFHVWVFFEEPMQAAYARGLGLQILEDLDKSVELFPKQNRLSGKGLGNLVKLPLGLHQKSGRWSKMNLNDIKQCAVDTSQIKAAPSHGEIEDKLMIGGYRGREPNCITKIRRGVRKGDRNNAGLVYAAYLANFRNYNLDHINYSMKLWNRNNKPRLEDGELHNIINQAVKAEYVFGCKHDYLKNYCRKEGCVFE